MIRPPNSLWGKETELALANFDVSGQPLPIEIVHALADIKAEAAVVNFELLEDASPEQQRRSQAISSAARSVADGAHDQQFLIDVFQTGSGTSTNMNVNEVVARLAGEASGLSVHPNDDVNASQSSNDTFPTAVTIASVVQIHRELIPALRGLIESLRSAGRRFDGVVKAGRTHLMDAVPILLSDEFGGYAAQLDEGLQRMAGALNRIGRVPLGGTAVGNGLNAPPEFGRTVIARLAHRHQVDLSIAPDRFSSQAGRDSIVETSSVLRGLAVSLIKIANDIRLMGSGPATGLGELRLPELQAGSSIMPGKVNPVMCEVVTQVGAQVIGNDAVIAFAASQGQFELNTYQPVMAANLLGSIRLLARACVLFAEKCIDGIVADEQRCRTFAESTPALATGLNEALGYDHVARIVKQAVAERRPLIDVVVEDGALQRHTAAALLDAARVARGNRS
ncbi:MAG: class II fumarate hydratase [Ilumatobacteraceae bacterium]